MEVFVTRLPVFDRQYVTAGYDLLFKAGFDQTNGNHGWDCATDRSLVLGFLSSHLNTLTSGRAAYIQINRNMLTQEIFSLFPKDLSILVLLQSLFQDEEVLAACKMIKKQGYRLAVEIVSLPVNPVILELVSSVRVDLRCFENDELRPALAEFESRQIAVEAVNLRNQKDLELALEFGCSYLQGEYVYKVRNRTDSDMAFSKLSHFKLLQEIHDHNTSFERLSSIIKRDVTLSYRLLNYINSAFFGLANEIRSLKYALVLLGLLHIRKWLSQVTLREIGRDKPEELLQASIIRARFSELLASKVGLAEYEQELFLVGLFSRLDVFLDKPMAEIMAELPVAQTIKNALLKKESPLSPAYALLLAYEKGKWEIFQDLAAKMKVRASEVPVLFLQAVEWAEQIFSD